ncbi:hypothetical protein COT29_04525 [Candidatus Micrarchaeota archaeon CG08_land_8_20_14_0_20_59_11]|nr:MAG: hypothetical protein COT29_04525 [Candidatus Micrarchaeota archaeon CG08_land_8_20_14_0_20_59_11]
MAKKSFLRKAGSFVAGIIIWILKAAWHVLKVIAGAVWDFVSGLFGKAAASAAKKTETRKAQYVALDEVKAFEGTPDDFENWLYSSKSTVGLILGARGSGKSGLGLKLLENWASRGRRVFAMGFGNAGLPAWIESVKSPEDVPNGAVLLADEGGISFSSRESMSDANRLLSKLLFIARHKDISILFISQNSANIEVNTIRQADYLLLKRPSLLQKDFERGKIKDVYESVADDFKKLGGDKGLVYVYSDAFRGFASNALPSFWSERASKAFGGVKLGAKSN